MADAPDDVVTCGSRGICQSPDEPPDGGLSQGAVSVSVTRSQTRTDVRGRLLGDRRGYLTSPSAIGSSSGRVIRNDSRVRVYSS